MLIKMKSMQTLSNKQKMLHYCYFKGSKFIKLYFKTKVSRLVCWQRETYPKLFGKCSISSVFSWHVPFWKISIVKQSQHPELFHMIFAKLANLLLHFWPDIFHWLTNVLWSKMRLTLIYQISVMLDNLSTLGGIEMRLMK